MPSDDSFRACRLCPHRCGVDRTAGARGVCGAYDAMRVSRAALHFWEEPPISGEAGSGTIFFAHCTLGCAYCQNATISRRDTEAGRVASVDEVARMCLDLERQGAMNVNLVTPTHYAPLVREAVCLARERGMRLPVVWNTSGYETVSAVRDNEGIVDVYLTDFKYADGALARELSGVRDYPMVALAALDEMVRLVGEPTYDDVGGMERMTRGVIVRHMLIPGHGDDSREAIRLLCERYGDAVRLSIMNQYTPVVARAAEAGDASAQAVLARHPELGERVSDEEYERLLCYADALGAEDYFWQAGDTCQESFIPDFA